MVCIVENGQPRDHRALRGSLRAPASSPSPPPPPASLYGSSRPLASYKVHQGSAAVASVGSEGMQIDIPKIDSSDLRGCSRQCW
jgi:hypothetical protein